MAKVGQFLVAIDIFIGDTYSGFGPTIAAATQEVSQRRWRSKARGELSAT
jgi:hypothetical protein